MVISIKRLKGIIVLLISMVGFQQFFIIVSHKNLCNLVADRTTLSGSQN